MFGRGPRSRPGSENSMSKLTALKKFDAAEHLGDAAAVAAYIEDAIALGDSAFLVDAIGVVARAKGMTEIARKSGLSRESLYKALRRDGNPEFATVMKVIDAMGLRLAVEAPKVSVASKPRRVQKSRTAKPKVKAA